MAARWFGPYIDAMSEAPSCTGCQALLLQIKQLQARIDQWTFCPDALEVYRRWRAGDFPEGAP